jgi:hypothetical protein
MKKIDLVQSIAILANAGVIAGLVFVGLQLRQDHLIARQQMAFTSADQSLYWAELATNNSELWFKGLSGELLVAKDLEAFNTLAEAWIIRLYTGFTGTSQLSPLGIANIFVYEAALKIGENPGLSRWWLSFQERMRTIDQAFGYVDLVNREIERLAGEQQ